MWNTLKLNYNFGVWLTYHDIIENSMGFGTINIRIYLFCCSKFKNDSNLKLKLQRLITSGAPFNVLQNVGCSTKLGQKVKQ